MPGFIWGHGKKGPTSGLKTPGMKEALGPNMELELELPWPITEQCWLGTGGFACTCNCAL